ncbi:MAG: MFS transporter [Alphaproteobacteria bacterium]|nr:MFS transporter [Alphaproteobacteria bacterium]
MTDAGTKPAARYGTAITALAATTWIQAVVSWAMLTVPVFAPSAAAELDLSPSKVGYFAGIAYVGAMTGALLGGGLVPRYGAIWLSQVGLVICALALALATSGMLALFALAGLLLGIGYGPTTPASSHVLSRHTPQRLMSLVFSIKQTGVPLGGALAGATVPPLTLAWGWRGAAIGVGLACLATVLLVHPTRRRLDADRNPDEPLLRGSPLAPVRFVLGRSDLRVLALTSVVFAAMQQCLGVFLVVYLTGEIGLGLVTAGLVLSFSQGAGIAGRIFWGWLADRLKLSRPILGGLAVGMAGASAAMALCAADWPIALIVLVSCLYGVTAVGWNGVLLAEVARLATPREASRATGGTLFITFFGVAVGPALFGEIARQSGSFVPMFLILAALAVPCAISLLWNRGTVSRVA